MVDIEYELTGRQVADTWYREGRFFDYNICRWQKGKLNALFKELGSFYGTF